MSRGFICWLDSRDGKSMNDVRLYQGDKVEFRPKKRWFQGTIHCHKGCYKFRHRSREFLVLFRFNLRALAGRED